MLNTYAHEAVLVCVYYGPNAEKLIKRGGKIASNFHCPLYILTVDKEEESEFSPEKTAYIQHWEALARQYGVQEVIVRDNEKRPFVKVLNEIVRQKNITQVIVGQTAESRWKEITKGSLMNVLLKELPFIDLHIISVSREVKGDDSQYETGARAFLVQENQQFKIIFHHQPDVLYEGLFFKETGTDFNNGVFKFMKESDVKYITIQDSYVVENEKI